jgi:hypothetical protein
MERLLGRMPSSKKLSDLHLRGIMIYREREAGLSEKFKDCYVIIV